MRPGFFGVQLRTPLRKILVVALGQLFFPAHKLPAQIAPL